MTIAASPRWDLSSMFSGLGAADYSAAMQRLTAALDEAEALFAQQGIERLPSSLQHATAELAEVLDHLVVRLSELQVEYDTLESFLHALVTTNSYDDQAAREASRLELLDVRRQQLEVRFRGWLGSLEPVLPQLIAARPRLAEHRFFLEHTAHQSRYLMSGEMESLAAELCVAGGAAFGKLQGTVTSQLKVPFERNGVREELPITVIRNLSFDPDPQVRRRAYDAEISGWHSIRTTIAACLNGVKGTAITLAKRRGRDHVLDAALDDNRIDRPTLDALLGAIEERLPMFRRYLQAKARRLGHAGALPWWDLFAPLGESHRTFSWDQARTFLLEHFSGFSPELGKFARRAFDEQWIDAEPRDGKRGGAYCMPVVGRDESRVLCNFDGSFDQVSTLAHELGHGFHNACQAKLPVFLRGSPSTLAETASIFCETLIAEAALREASRDEQLAILEIQVGGATQVCVDILSRFKFESAVFAQRATGELTADDFCRLMRQAQSETYGDAVQPETYQPYMWLWKPHYYAYAHNFYNFPYAFGHLFGLGLFSIYRREGASFVPRYMELLRSTAKDQAAPLAARFGLDITHRDFWRGSLDVVEDQVRRFEQL